MTRWHGYSAKAGAAGVLLVLLAACSEPELILPGSREAVLPSADQISLDSSATVEGAGLADPASQPMAGHPGGDAGHSGGHLAFAEQPAKLWEARIAGVPDATAELAQPVISAGKVLAVGADARLSAFDLQSGAAVWQAEIEPRLDDPLPGIAGGLAADNRQVVAHAGGVILRSFALSDGRPVWSVRHQVPLRGGPTLLASGAVAVTDLDGRIFVYALADGSLIWQRAGLPVTTVVFGAPAPAEAGNLLLLAGAAGEIAAHQSDSGGLVWADSLASFNPRTPLEELGDIRAHPVAAGGLALFASQSGRLAAFDQATGLLAWEQPVSAIEMPWVAGQTVFVVTLDGRLYALRLSDGAPRWVAELPGALPAGALIAGEIVRYAGPVVAGGQVWLVSASGTLLAYDAESGVLRQKLSAGGQILAAPQIADQVMILLDSKGRLQAWR